jgi:transposase
MLEIIHPNAAGIDIGSREIYVAPPEAAGRDAVRKYGTYTPDIEMMVRWLKECGVTTVAMESTGVYWIGVYEALERAKIEVCLVNGRHQKNVPGRKSDVQDCQWLRDLHRVGLTRASFRPRGDIVVLRGYMRQRENLINQRSVQVNLMQKAMVEMNVRLEVVVSDVTGQTGLRIMRAIAAGERDKEKLAALRDRRCKGSLEEFIKALSAVYREEQVFILKQALSIYDFYGEQIERCEKAIMKQFESIEVEDDQTPLPPLPELGQTSKKSSHSKNDPYYDARAQVYRLTGVDLTEITGIMGSIAQTIISEIGLDMSRWPTVKHFCAWLGLSPRNEITGGKVKRSKKAKGNERVALALRRAAQSAAKSKSEIGAYYRKMKTRKDAPHAISATAHKLARIVYTMLKHRTAFKYASTEAFEQKQREREVKRLHKQASKLGFQLVESTFG